MKNLRAIREKSGMSQEELAKKAGVSRVTISNLETGKQVTTTTDILLKLAKALNESIVAFF